MNRWVGIGRLVSDPEVRNTNAGGTVARFKVAVDRRFKRDGEPDADFLPCIAFGKQAEFTEKYLKKGTKIACEGRIKTGSYTNKDGQKVYTTDIAIDNLEFAESKNAQGGQQATTDSNGFMVVDEIDSELPFA